MKIQKEIQQIEIASLVKLEKYSNMFLIMTGKEILNHFGSVSHEQAIEKAQIEFEKHKEKLKDEILQVGEDFIKQITAAEKKRK